MTKQRGDLSIEAAVLLGTLAFLAAAVMAAAMLDKASCTSRWGQSGLQTSWGPVQGCLVKTPSGRWLPEDRLREIDITNKEPT